MDELFNSKVIEWWDNYTVNSSSSFILHEKLQVIKKKTKLWAAEHIPKAKTELQDLRKRLMEIDCSINNDEEDFREKLSIKTKISDICKQEDESWKQKSRIRWAKQGDVNSKLFHITASLNRNRNKITKLKVDNVSISKKHEIEMAVCQHYKAFFSNAECINVKTYYLEELNCNRLSYLDSANMIRPFSFEEIDQVVLSVKGGKAPGPDGFNMDFF